MEERREIVNAYPLLNDKLFQVWTGEPLVVVDALQAKLIKIQPTIIESNGSKAAKIEPVPLPRKRVTITHRDKDLFLQDAFRQTQDYFEFALRQLELSDSSYSTDLQKMPPSKFTATIYVDGEVGNRCKIWIGGLGSSDSICYAEGNSDPYRDGSVNEFLTISVDDGVVAINASMDTVFGRKMPDGGSGKYSAGRFLWERIIERISWIVTTNRHG